MKLLFSIFIAAIFSLNCLAAERITLVDGTSNEVGITANPLIVTVPGGVGIKNVVEDTTPQLGGDLDLNSKNIDFPTTANISDCLDEDNMASDSATKLATQQSIKAYVDSLALRLTSFDTGWINRSDWTNVHMGSAVVDYDNLSGTFTVGETITEATSSNTGVVMSDNGSVLVLKEVTGTGIFIDGRQLTGGDSEATADVNVNTKNTDENTTHNLNVPVSDLLVKILISTDGTDNNSFDFFYGNDNSAANYGINVSQVDSNNLLLQTGSGGFVQLTTSGTVNAVASDDWYYKIKIYKLE